MGKREHIYEIIAENIRKERRMSDGTLWEAQTALCFR